MNDALTGLIGLVGAGGVTSIVIAYLSYKTEAAKGRRGAAPNDLVGSSGTFPGSSDFELLANALAGLTGAVVRSNLIAEFNMGPVRGPAFKHAAEERDLRELREAFDQLKRSGRPSYGVTRPGTERSER